VQGLEGSRDFYKEWSGNSNWSRSGEWLCEGSEHVIDHVVVTMVMCLVTWGSCDLIWGFGSCDESHVVTHDMSHGHVTLGS